MHNEFGFYELIWSFCIAILLFFSIVCYVLYQLIGEKSFKYYSFYCLALLIYLSLKLELIHHYFWSHWFDVEQPNALVVNFNWFIQVIFYTFYSMFGIYFTDVDLVFPKFSKRIKRFLYWQLGFATVLFFVATIAQNKSWFLWFFLGWFVPFLLIQFVVLLPKMLLTKGKLKWVFISGLVIYILGALTALYFSFNVDQLGSDAPLIFFLFGVLIESIFFGLGIAFKYKEIYEDRAEKNKELATLEYNQQINILRGLMEGEQRERKRVSSELHDNLGNLIATALLQFDTVARTNKEVENHDNYKKGMNLLDSAADEVRSIAHNMMPTTIYEHGLAHAIEEIAKNITTIDVQFTSEKKEYTISEKQTVFVYRIVQEAFNNIIKHAKASTVMVQLLEKDNHLKLTIKDNGIGFQETEIEPGLGLKSLRSRADLIGAQLAFNSTIGKGTELVLLIPLSGKVKSKLEQLK